MDQEQERANHTYSFLKKVLIVVLIVVSITLLLMFVGRAIDTLLVIFAGILLGVIFRAARDFIYKKTGLPKSLSLTGVVLFVVSLFMGMAYLLGPRVYQQGQMLYEEVPEKWEEIKVQIRPYGWGKELAQENPHFRDFFEDETDQTGEDYDMTKSILNFFGNLTTITAAFFLIFITAIYIAAEPKLYTEGFIRLFPPGRRQRVNEIIDEISLTIQRWLVGQVFSMLILGTLTTLGLWLLGMPYPLLLGIFTALMTFIPNLGPIIAAIPTLLLAITEGIELTIYVAIFYTFVQCVEGYFITPMIHRRAISVPPVLIITCQFLFYYLLGFLGVLLAMPLVACGMIIVKRLYIQDILKDPINMPASTNLEGKNIF
ncbi:AI-2E family transporter [Gracilimonas mengyeensis]|uniref:Predicted PurR-regulated permease PerM n=1 Tax=Gracilimonas mengyeensis TaxID=1302730 RepID=A0A521DP36_9BACT|nr:AI-2E family transporter [Gracilimonas mengyeensis]SMO73466.1 Predicted PurR-regulated permease PerM [Gracilimonas mengyeensis]